MKPGEKETSQRGNRRKENGKRGLDRTLGRNWRKRNHRTMTSQEKEELERKSQRRMEELLKREDGQ